MGQSRRLSLLLLLSVTFGCGSSGVSPTSSPYARTNGVVATPAAGGSISPSPIGLLTSPSATPQPTTRPTVTPPPTLSAAEEELTFYVRSDVLVDCQARRTNLPRKTIAAIECTPDVDLVARVGLYAFEERDDALGWYHQRLTEAGVEPRSGDCVRGIAGDATWEGVDELELDPGSVSGEGWIVDGHPYMGGRIGCFLDQDGDANVRVTCGDTIYYGIVGTVPDLRALTAWAYLGPDEILSGKADEILSGQPGICSFEDVY